MKKHVRILCSGVALGVYIPGIAIDRQLKVAGVRSGVDVIENLLKREKRDNIGANKRRFHTDFRFALMGQKVLAGDLWPHFDREAMQALFDEWKKTGVDGFIMLSGFWMSVIREYLALPGIGKPAVDILHMDSDYSPSWNNFRQSSAQYGNQWWVSWSDRRLVCEILRDGGSPAPYGGRARRFVIHGGGWGMGVYQTVIPELVNAGNQLDVIVHGPEEAGYEKGNRYFMVDPGWDPWRKNDSAEHEYPPFGELRKGAATAFRNGEEQHGVFALVKGSRGVISKPGGSTMSDSLSSGTPLVLLEPFGEHERKNADLWEELGFGIRYEKWRDAGFDERVLEKLHENVIRARDNLPRYVPRYLERN